MSNQASERIVCDVLLQFMTLDFLQWQSLKPLEQLEVILVHSSNTVSVHVYFGGILIAWPAFDRTACSRCPC